MENIEIFKAQLSAIGDSIRAKTGSTDKIPFDQLSAEIDKIEGEGLPEMFILEDEDGNQMAAVLTDETIELTADKTTDIRKGTTAVTSEGVVQGEKEIPACHVTEGARAIPNGSECILFITNYDYTKLQAIMCLFNTNLSNSVAADRVAINTNVYPVQSVEAETAIEIDHESGSIKFGITNTSGKPYLIRYFSYKEIY